MFGYSLAQAAARRQLHRTAHRLQLKLKTRWILRLVVVAGDGLRLEVACYLTTIEDSTHRVQTLTKVDGVSHPLDSKTAAHRSSLMLRRHEAREAIERHHRCDPRGHRYRYRKNRQR